MEHADNEFGPNRGAGARSDEGFNEGLTERLSERFDAGLDAELDAEFDAQWAAGLDNVFKLQYHRFKTNLDHVECLPLRRVIRLLPADGYKWLFHASQRCYGRLTHFLRTNLSIYVPTYISTIYHQAESIQSPNPLSHLLVGPLSFRAFLRDFDDARTQLRFRMREKDTEIPLPLFFCSFIVLYIR